MPLLSYNCLIKLNLCPTHLFRFQRTWFYPSDQGRPRPGYQTMSTIKGTLRHSRKRGKKGDSEVQKIYSQSPRRERREPRERNLSHTFEIIQNTTQPPKKHMPKHAHIRYHFLPQKSSSPNYLGRQYLSKATWT